MPSCDVNAATRLAEASWRRDKVPNIKTLRKHNHKRQGVKLLMVSSVVKYKNYPHKGLY